MTTRQEWTAHVFNLGIDPGWAHNIMTRVQDTEIRLKHYCAPLTDAQLSHRPNGAWSIKEHIGHLIDLEPLHQGRLQQLAVLQPELTGADMSNAKTEAADHNAQSLEALLEEFRRVRTAFIREFKALPSASLQHAAQHPRLKVPMKPVDVLFFVAEHDDHHLATILENIDTLGL